MVNNFEVYSNRKKIESQLEDIKFFKDGFVRSATLVITPSIQQRSQITITLMKVDDKLNPKIQSRNFIKTKSAEVSLSKIGGF